MCIVYCVKGTLISQDILTGGGRVEDARAARHGRDRGLHGGQVARAGHRRGGPRLRVAARAGALPAAVLLASHALAVTLVTCE